MSKPTDTTKNVTTRLRFVDFAVRAWRGAERAVQVKVIAHSTPAGAMRSARGRQLRKVTPQTTFASQSTHHSPTPRPSGRSLAQLVVPAGLWRMLGESLQIVAAPARPRICAYASAWTTT